MNDNTMNQNIEQAYLKASLGGKIIGLPVTRIRAILGRDEFCLRQGAVGPLVGTVDNNLYRGPVFDVGLLLGLPSSTPDEIGNVVVVEVRFDFDMVSAIGICLDRAHEVIFVPKLRGALPPLETDMHQFFTGQYEDQDECIYLVDLGALLSELDLESYGCVTRWSQKKSEQAEQKLKEQHVQSETGRLVALCDLATDWIKTLDKSDINNPNRELIKFLSGPKHGGESN